MSDLTQIAILLQRVILPINAIIGIMGNSLNIAVLTRRSLFYHACSRYFLALAGNNLFYSAIIITNRILSNGYQINITTNSIIACKIINYISTLSSFLATYFIILASIDRCCASSHNAQIRKFSNVRVAHGMILLVVGILALFFIHILIICKLDPGKGFTCVTQADTTYFQVYIIIQVLLFAVVPPSLMMICGIITIKNMKRSRVVPISISRFNRTENQLGQMLFFQVGAHILLTLPTSVSYLIGALPNPVRSTSTYAFAAVICQMLFTFSIGMPFFSYILSSRVYRKQLKRLIYKTFRKRVDNQDDPSANQNTIHQGTAVAKP
ncbi:unnamed protein product [Adineta steineri]|uniref:G-protein coupled receptors family 1 profile domain-containing protein n=2 Tax=Adineta steineri TaxID=433720 RepID=A0A819M8R4_9BILA|nr:unnamed protein product [Adineta steineri]CAF3975693.1 unnamed protein product [Adineta steineri]